MEKNKRIEWVDYLKAFACFLVVLGHLIQSLQKANIDHHMNITNFINWFIYLFHMPLFMCVSGFLYCKSKREFSWKWYKEFELKKFINLVIPYFTFYLIFLGINVIFASSVNSVKGMNELIGMFNNPMPPYWFLYALLSIFIVVPILDHIFKNNKKAVFVLFIILRIISIFLKTNIYFIDSVMSYALYFYLGVFINENSKFEKKKCTLINIFSIIIYIIMSIIYYRHKMLCSKVLTGLINIVFAISGILICINIFRMINSPKILNTFKKYTFQIYLTHTIFAAGIRIVLLKLGVTNYFIQFIIGLIGGIYVPVIMSIISDKIKYTNIFFYPVKTINELKERKSKDVRKEA